MTVWVDAWIKRTDGDGAVITYHGDGDRPSLPGATSTDRFTVREIRKGAKKDRCSEREWLTRRAQVGLARLRRYDKERREREDGAWEVT